MICRGLVTSCEIKSPTQRPNSKNLYLVQDYLKRSHPFSD
jgi:hypothetical protein